MASKEATIYIVDVGNSMGRRQHGREETNLEYAMSYVWDKLATTTSANLKSRAVGVIGLRTDSTKNYMADGDAFYNNISVLKDVGPISLSDLRSLQTAIHVSETDSGDAMSSIALATGMMEQATTLKSGKPGKYGRKIIVVTDGHGIIDEDGLEEQTTSIAEKMNEWGIELTVIGVDFDDAEFGFKEEDKDLVKKNNEGHLKKLVDQCSEGTFGTLAEAIEYIGKPEVKTVRPVASYKLQLVLGDPQKFPDTAIQINVERYPKTMAARPPTASRFVDRGAASTHAAQDIDMKDAPDMSAVTSDRKYEINDPSAPGGKRAVELDSLEKGYRYGSTSVPISASDETVTKLEYKAEFRIIGFVPKDYGRYLNMGNSCITIASNIDNKSKLALSSFVHALAELDTYAVARFVKKDGAEPQILLLAPLLEPDLEALIDIPLPFAEDVRSYRFPPLDKIILTSGEAKSKHRFLPEDDLKEAMSDFVDSMDLSDLGRDDEENSAEYMITDEMYSPVLHRVNQAIRTRAIKPDELVKPPAEILVKFRSPPDTLVEKSRGKLEKLIKAAKVQKVPPKAKGRKTAQSVQPLSGLDVDAILGSTKTTRGTSFSRDNAIPEFRQWMDKARSTEDNAENARLLGEVLEERLKSSTGNSEWANVAEHLRVMREVMKDFEGADIYNDYLRRFKNLLLEGELGYSQKEFWVQHICGGGLGLIHEGEDELGEGPAATKQEAKEFLKF